jgi:hypothetical protein
MKTYLVSYQDCGSSLDKSLHVTQARTGKEAVQNAIEAYGFPSQVVALAEVFGPKETYLAFHPEDISEEEALKQFREGFLYDEVSILHAVAVADVLGKTLKAGNLL